MTDYYEQWISKKGRASVFGDVPKHVLFSSSNDYRESEYCIGMDGYVMAQKLWRQFATSVVNAAVKKGELAPVATKRCVKCKGKAVDYHHHKGYHPKNLLNVIPVCRVCHKSMHPPTHRSKKR